MSSTKLNIFQRAFLQKCATVLAYFVSIALGASFLDWLDKRLFIRLAEEAQEKGFLSENGAQGFTTLIQARDETAIFVIILVGLACALIGWFFVIKTARWNWSLPVTLPKVVEFRDAMETLGIVDPEERIAFVRKHNLPVFIAYKPLIGLEHDNVRCRLYPFANYSLLASDEIFKSNIGNQTLCLDAEDYGQLLDEFGPRTRSTCAIKIAELEQTISDLKSANALQRSEIASLTEANQKLLLDSEELKRQKQTAPGREAKADTSNLRRVAFWRVAAPMINRMIEEAQPDTKYTTTEIQTLFNAEIEKFPDLKDDIKLELRRHKHNPPASEFDLDGWAMDSIRKGLGNFAQREAKRPKKSKNI